MRHFASFQKKCTRENVEQQVSMEAESLKIEEIEETTGQRRDEGDESEQCDGRGDYILFVCFTCGDSARGRDALVETGWDPCVLHVHDQSGGE